MAALLCGLALRLWFVLRHGYVTGDTLVYGDIARNLLQRHVYGFTTGPGAGGVRATLIRLPGYPLFLALCFRLFGVERYSAVLLVQVVMDLWTCLLLGGVAGRMWGVRAGRAAVWLAALCPFTANYTAAPLTEVLTLWCMAAAFYGLVRWSGKMDRWVPVLGAALAFAVLLRPEQGLLAAAVVPGMMWIGWGKERTWRIAGPVAAVCLLTVLPLGAWGWRNWKTFHVVQPLAPRQANDPGELVPYGFQRWYRTWGIEFASTDDVYWNYDGGPIAIEDIPARAFDTRAQYEATDALLAEYNEKTTATAALDGRFAALADQRVRASRLRYYVALPVARLLNMALRPRTEMLPIPLEWWRFSAHKLKTAEAAMYAALNLGYFGLAWVGLRRVRWTAVTGVMAATVALRSALLLTVDNSEPRYTLEFFPVLMVLGAAAWVVKGGVRDRVPE